MNFDLSELDAALADTETRAKRLGPAFRELRKPMAADQRRHAKEERGPDTGWPPRSPLTEAKRRARNRGVRRTKAMRTIAIGKFRRRSTPKRILGRLPGAMVIEVGELFIRVSSRVPWAISHMLGLRVGRGAKLPQRRFYWLSDALIGAARDKLGAFVVKGMKR